MVWFFLGFLSYFFVLLSERVLVGVTLYDIEQLHTTQTWRARRAYTLVQQIRATFAALLLARVLLKILISVFIANTLAHAEPVRTTLSNWAQATALPGTVIWGFACLVLVAALSVLFWWIKKISRPKFEAGRAREALQRLVPFFMFWRILFDPFLPRAGVPRKTETAAAVSDAAPPFPTRTEEKSDLAHTDLALLKSIVKFSDTTVKHVMQPRSKVVAVDFRLGFDDLLRTVQETEFSRIPVYDEDLDNATGMLYVKDLIAHLDKPGDFEWQPLIRTELLRVPDAKPAGELLREFKNSRQHIALVVDEYGGCSGIVTLEDILEEITGEIRDEFDAEHEVRFRKIDDRNFLFEGQTLLSDVCRIAKLTPGTFDNARGNADTLAGLALEIKGDIPAPGDAIELEGYRLIIIAADGRKIDQLKLTITA